MAYPRNDTEIYRTCGSWNKCDRSRSVSELMDTLLQEHQIKKKMKSNCEWDGNRTQSAFNDCYASLSTNMSTNLTMSSYMNPSLCMSQGRFNGNAMKDESLIGRIKDCTRDMKGRRYNERIEKLNEKMIKNVDVMNIRYKDTNSNNYFLCNLNRFKDVTRYNTKTQTMFSRDLYPNTGYWTVNVTNKIYQYRNTLK